MRRPIFRAVLSNIFDALRDPMPKQVLKPISRLAIGQVCSLITLGWFRESGYFSGDRVAYLTRRGHEIALEVLSPVPESLHLSTDDFLKLVSAAASVSRSHPLL